MITAWALARAEEDTHASAEECEIASAEEVSMCQC